MSAMKFGSLWALGAAVILGAPAQIGAAEGALDAAAVLQKVLDAHGGKESWEAMGSLRIEGTYSAFSIDVPMTILRMRPDLYRMDFALFDTPTVLGFDGKQAWVKSAIFGAPDGGLIEDKWSRDVVLDARFGSVLLDLAARGARIEYAGTAKVEGQPVHVLTVAPADLPEETWYIDPDTWLETKRVARIYDVFTGPDAELEMDVFYMDYREVGGVKLPFREERHFGTRYLVYEASKIEVNPALDRAVFAVPAKPAP